MANSFANSQESQVMHPEWGYRYKMDVDGLVQPFDFDVAAVQELRSSFSLRPDDVVSPKPQAVCVSSALNR